LLSLALFGQAIPLNQFEARKDLRGVGFSDWEGYARRLDLLFCYENTFLHQEPFLDLCRPLHREHIEQYDFVVCSDVLEHVPRPVDASVSNLRKLLKPGGSLILTVPFVPTGRTVEHFGRLNRYDIVDFRGRRVLLNETKRGRLQLYDHLIFHGGDGATLEMRVFARRPLMRSLRKAGFSEIRVVGQDFPEFGIIWPSDHSLPLLCLK
jgi:SAM-dependent methyltransferase